MAMYGVADFDVGPILSVACIDEKISFPLDACYTTFLILFAL